MIFDVLFGTNGVLRYSLLLNFFLNFLCAYIPIPLYYLSTVSDYIFFLGDIHQRRLVGVLELVQGPEAIHSSGLQSPASHETRTLVTTEEREMSY